MPRTLITGDAGLIGSHLCDRLVEEGHKALCLDNLITGSRDNINHLQDHPQFTFKVIELTSSNSKIMFETLPQDDPKLRRPDISKAQALGWAPKIQLDVGLGETISFSIRS